MKPLNKEYLTFYLNTKVYLKDRVLFDLSKYLEKYKNSNVLVVCDNYIKKNKTKNNYLNKSIKFLKKKQIIYNDYFEPTFENLEKLSKLVKVNNIKIIIGVGGGSTIDIAKGMATLLSTRKNIRNFQGSNKVDFTVPKIVAIPSIFGSGAEVTPSAVFINSKKELKGGINSESVRPSMAFLDPNFVSSKNYQQHVLCAFDSLVHSFESYNSTLSNSFTKNISRLGILKIFKGFNLLKKRNKIAFKYLAEGSLYSIISLMHSEQNIAGAASYQLAVYYKYNHAYCGASFLSDSLKLSEKKFKNSYSEITDLLFKEKIIKKNNFKELIYTLNRILLDHKIKKIILNDEQINFLWRKVIEMPMIKFSPYKIYKKDIINFLKHD